MVGRAGVVGSRASAVSVAEIVFGAVVAVVAGRHFALEHHIATGAAGGGRYLALGGCARIGCSLAPAATIAEIVLSVVVAVVAGRHFVFEHHIATGAIGVDDTSHWVGVQL